MAITTQGIQQAFHWMGFFFWIFITSYLGCSWWSILCWIFIVPIILSIFFRIVYNLAPSTANNCWLRFYATLSQELNLRDGSTNPIILIHWNNIASIIISSHNALQETSIWQLSKQHKAQQSLFMTVHWATLMHMLWSSWLSNLCHISWYIDGTRCYSIGAEYGYDTLLCNPWILMSWHCIPIPATMPTRWIYHFICGFNSNLNNLYNHHDMGVLIIKLSTN